MKSLVLVLLVVLGCTASSRPKPGSSAAAPQYILFSAQTGDSASTNFTAALLDVRAGWGSNAPVVGKDRVLFGAHLLLNVLQAGNSSELERYVWGVLSAAVATGIPVLMGWDAQVWWSQRSDLWNWFDPTQPGYDPANRQNVEWVGWGDQNAIELSWLNWGRQMRMTPAQNIHAPAVRAATHAAFATLSGAVSKWLAGASDTEKLLLAGIKLGCEASIGNSQQYILHAT